uniref:Uncharacterized protein n=1 Tax=Cucumis melo TaxID=3656 RepID=A0A9I9EF88_CUCME
MLYLAEVPDSICFLESRLEEIAEKTDTIDAVAGRVEGLPIQELLARVDTLEGNVGRIVNYEYGDSFSGLVSHMEERANELDSSQKTLLEMINVMSEDFRVTLDVIRNEIVDVNARLNLTVQEMQSPSVGQEMQGPWRTIFLTSNNTSGPRTKLLRKSKLHWQCCTIDTWDALKKELRS